MPQIEFRQQSLYYTVAGDGPPVVLLHGFCGDHRVWESVVPGLRGQYRVITPDLPGCGRSGLPAALEIPLMADAVVRLLDALEIAAAPVIGHSMGGYVALEVAARHPGRLSALGLVHSHPFARVNDEEPGVRRRSIAFMERYGAALFVKQSIPAAFAPGYPDRLEVEKQTYRALETPTAGLVACQRAMLHRADHTATLSACPVPVLQIHGHHDTVVPTAIQEAMSILAPQTRVHWLPAAGHFGPAEAPKAVSRLLRQFLAATS